MYDSLLIKRINFSYSIYIIYIVFQCNILWYKIWCQVLSFSFFVRKLYNKLFTLNSNCKFEIFIYLDFSKFLI